MRVLILTNGDYGDYSFCKGEKKWDAIICADNGVHHAKKLQLTPDYIVGDLDSLDQKELLSFEQEGIRVKRYSPCKDETDTELAVDLAIELGATEIVVWGGTGSRIDHTLGNIQLLYKALKRQVKMILVGNKNKVQLIQDFIALQGKPGALVSLIPYSELVEGVSAKGLAYPLDGASFKLGQVYGISNYLLGEEASIEIQKGLLLVIQSQD